MSLWVPRSIACVFLGYPSSHKGYNYMVFATKHIIISHHTMFDKTMFPFARRGLPSNSTALLDFLVSDYVVLVHHSVATTPPHASTPSPFVGERWCPLIVHAPSQLNVENTWPSLLHHISNWAPMSHGPQHHSCQLPQFVAPVVVPTMQRAVSTTLATPAMPVVPPIPVTIPPAHVIRHTHGPNCTSNIGGCQCRCPGSLSCPGWPHSIAIWADLGIIMPVNYRDLYIAHSSIISILRNYRTTLVVPIYMWTWWWVKGITREWHLMSCSILVQCQCCYVQVDFQA